MMRSQLATTHKETHPAKASRALTTLSGRVTGYLERGAALCLNEISNGKRAWLSQSPTRRGEPALPIIVDNGPSRQEPVRGPETAFEEITMPAVALARFPNGTSWEFAGAKGISRRAIVFYCGD